MQNKNRLITALYKVLGDYPKRSLVAWDFSPSIWNETYKQIGQVLKEEGIEYQQPESSWGHISIALVKPLDKEQRNKVMMGGRSLKSPVSIEGIDVLPGKKYTYIALKIKVRDEYIKFYDFLVDILGEENVDKPMSYPYFRPHVSIATTSKETFDQVEDLIPKMEKAISKHMNKSVTPKQIQIWDDFQISDIEENEFK